MTLRLVPATVLRGVRFVDTTESVVRTVAALAPLVHTVVVLSHLGFDTVDGGDVQLIPALRNTRVSVILGGHTHDALDPAYVVDGITACNAGAHGVNVNQVTLTRNAHGSIEVRSKLLPQDHSVPETERFLAARSTEQRTFLQLQEARVGLPALPILASKVLPTGVGRDRELALLTTALRASGKASADTIQMVPFLYLLGQLPERDTVSHLEILTVYPNAEELVEITLSGSRLSRVIELQTWLSFNFSALPVWLDTGQPVAESELGDARTYRVIVSQLVAEGGLDWKPLREIDVHARPLDVTCAELVWDFLGNVPAAGVENAAAMEAVPRAGA